MGSEYNSHQPYTQLTRPGKWVNPTSSPRAVQKKISDRWGGLHLHSGTHRLKGKGKKKASEWNPFEKKPECENTLTLNVNMKAKKREHFHISFDWLS